MRLDQAIHPSKINKVPQNTVIGIDIGSRQSKAVLLFQGGLYTAIVPTGFFMQETADALLQDLFEQSGITMDEVEQIVSTGYGRVALNFDPVPGRILTEIACHGMGAHFLGENIRTIIDIGGQDSKTIRIDPADGKVLDFAMNDKCAAGTGRFLERIANVLGVDVTELGEISGKAADPLDISAQCIVFAESEVVSARAKGKEAADIAAGIHKSVARRVSGLLSRVGIEKGLLFTGGVADNSGMKKAFEELIGFPVEESRLDTVYAGALGAAVFAGRFAERLEKQAGQRQDSFSLDLSSLIEAQAHERELLIQNQTGKKKRVGYLCAYVPAELLFAADVSYYRILSAGNQDEIMAGESITQSVFCDLTKSVVGGFITDNPAYTCLDHLYTFFTCDCMRKAVEAIGAQYVPATVYNMPRLRKDPVSRDYFITEIRNFKRDLEELTGEAIREEDIRESIALHNKARRYIREISAYRKKKGVLLTGSQFQQIARSYYSLPVDRLLEQLEQILAQLQKAEVSEERSLPRIMLSGGIVAEGDTKITGILEELGAQVVAEDNCTGLKPFLRDIPENGTWEENLADGYLGQAPCARMKPLNEMIEHSVRLAEEYAADGVVIYYLKFCPCYSMMLRDFTEAFQKRKIPVLVVASDYSRGDEGQIKIRMEAFLEMLKGAKE